MTPKAVIFDCDGVIVDSEPMTLAFLRDDLAAHGLDMPIGQMHDLFVGGTIAGVAQQARSLGADLPEGWVADFYDRLYGLLAGGTALVPGILTVLDALDAAGIPYAIGSNGTDRKMQVTLGQHPGLIPRFRGLLSGQAIGRPKPAPDLYLAAADLLGTAPADCAVVEDSATGARAARAAGIPCWGYAPEGNERLAAEGATLFRRMTDLPGLLGL